uniref:Uncharacterized protein n=1 Tax=Utricularia reniformis TaxID=192314 RepID=A0A1Y0B0D5_9LAMI|nr:hypothetical protein AEK19_MT0653 [Utricularia reniformis]ART30906.1 hypothetical protein AEK19_MT0653 [Utricularia reniformis]
MECGRRCDGIALDSRTYRICSEESTTSFLNQSIHKVGFSRACCCQVCAD